MCVTRLCNFHNAAW